MFGGLARIKNKEDRRLMGEKWKKK